MKKFLESPVIFVAGVILFVALTMGGCSIKIYRVDQQTVLEDEAAGEWPDFEREIVGKSQAATPTPFPSVASTARKDRLFNVLNSVAPASNTALAVAPAPTGAVKK